MRNPKLLRIFNWNFKVKSWRAQGKCTLESVRLLEELHLSASRSDDNKRMQCWGKFLFNIPATAPITSVCVATTEGGTHMKLKVANSIYQMGMGTYEWKLRTVSMCGEGSEDVRNAATVHAVQFGCTCPWHLTTIAATTTTASGANVIAAAAPFADWLTAAIEEFLCGIKEEICLKQSYARWGIFHISVPYIIYIINSPFWLHLCVCVCMLTNNFAST